MPRYNKYRPNYKKLYPNVVLTKEVLNCLVKSDRKIEYCEVDLKVEGFVCNQEKKIARFTPSREDSYDRLLEDRQFSVGEMSPEAEAVRTDEVRRLYACLSMLTDTERDIILALYFEGLSERELAKRINVHHMTVHSRKVKILGKMKNLMKK